MTTAARGKVIPGEDTGNLLQVALVQERILWFPRHRIQNCSYKLPQECHSSLALTGRCVKGSPREAKSSWGNLGHHHRGLPAGWELPDPEIGSHAPCCPHKQRNIAPSTKQYCGLKNSSGSVCLTSLSLVFCPLSVMGIPVKEPKRITQIGQFLKGRSSVWFTFVSTAPSMVPGIRQMFRKFLLMWKMRKVTDSLRSPKQQLISGMNRADLRGQKSRAREPATQVLRNVPYNIGALGQLEEDPPLRIIRLGSVGLNISFWLSSGSEQAELNKPSLEKTEPQVTGIIRLYINGSLLNHQRLEKNGRLSGSQGAISKFCSC